LERAPTDFHHPPHIVIPKPISRSLHGQYAVDRVRRLTVRQLELRSFLPKGRKTCPPLHQGLLFNEYFSPALCRVLVAIENECFRR